MKHPNECLKVVEIDGFVGREVEIDLIVCLLESAINLEKIVINPRDLHLVGTPQDKENEGTRECGEWLKKHLPLGAELIIVIIIINISKWLILKNIYIYIYILASDYV